MHASAVVDIQSTYGAAFLGVIVSTVLYGATLTQTWFYFGQYRNKDPVVLKCFVVILLILDTLHSILCVYSVYWYLVLNYGNVENLDLEIWAFNVQIDINVLISFVVQLFYARQVYILSNRIIFPVIIATLSTIYIAHGFVFSVEAAALHRFSRYGSPTLTWVAWVGLCSDTLADVVIALSMCWYLYRNRTGVSTTDSVIMTLMSYSLSSGVLTSMLAIAVLITYVAKPTTLICFAVFWPMGKCYVNSFLAILNNRNLLRERLSNGGPSSAFAMSSMCYDENPCKAGPTAITVTVHPLQTLNETSFERGKHDSETGPSALEMEKSEISHSTVREGLSESIV